MDAAEFAELIHQIAEASAERLHLREELNGPARYNPAKAEEHAKMTLAYEELGREIVRITSQLAILALG